MTLEDPMAVGEQRVDLEEILIDCIPGDTHFWFEEVGGDLRMAKTLGGFHHQVARRITGLTAKCGAGGEW